MIRLVKEDVGMSPETDEEVKCTTEATRFVSSSMDTNIMMCRTCEEIRCIAVTEPSSPINLKT